MKRLIIIALIILATTLFGQNCTFQNRVVVMWPYVWDKPVEFTIYKKSNGTVTSFGGLIDTFRVFESTFLADTNEIWIRANLPGMTKQSGESNHVFAYRGIPIQESDIPYFINYQTIYAKQDGWSWNPSNSVVQRFDGFVRVWCQAQYGDVRFNRKIVFPADNSYSFEIKANQYWPQAALYLIIDTSYVKIDVTTSEPTKTVMQVAAGERDVELYFLQAPSDFYYLDITLGEEPEPPKMPENILEIVGE
jgi:hypothetical protein